MINEKLKKLINAEFGMNEKGLIVDLYKYKKYLKLRIKNKTKKLLEYMGDSQ